MASRARRFGRSTLGPLPATAGAWGPSPLSYDVDNATRLATNVHRRHQQLHHGSASDSPHNQPHKNHAGAGLGADWRAPPSAPRPAPASADGSHSHTAGRGTHHPSRRAAVEAAVAVGALSATDAGRLLGERSSAGPSATAAAAARKLLERAALAPEGLVVTERPSSDTPAHPVSAAAASHVAHGFLSSAPRFSHAADHSSSPSNGSPRRGPQGGMQRPLPHSQRPLPGESTATQQPPSKDKRDDAGRVGPSMRKSLALAVGHTHTARPSGSAAFRSRSQRAAIGGPPVSEASALPLLASTAYGPRVTTHESQAGVVMTSDYDLTVTATAAAMGTSDTVAGGWRGRVIPPPRGTPAFTTPARDTTPAFRAMFPSGDTGPGPGEYEGVTHSARLGRPASASAPRPWAASSTVHPHKVVSKEAGGPVGRQEDDDDPLEALVRRERLRLGIHPSSVLSDPANDGVTGIGAPGPGAYDPLPIAKLHRSFAYNPQLRWVP